MGKYMRKAKLTGDVVALMESSLGVRTRAKTLALQKLQASKAPTSPLPSPPEEHASELSYLQLRSRRLEKPLFQQLTCCRQQNPNPSKANSRLVISSGVSGSIESGSVGEKKVACESQIKGGEETEESCYFGGEEASFGENNIDFDGRESRSTRESTPCSLIRDLNAISTPGSSTRARTLEASNRRTQISFRRSMPLAQEIEEFFARHEQEQQRRFTDKFNFDIGKETPLDGRYEWVSIQSQ